MRIEETAEMFFQQLEETLSENKSMASRYALLSRILKRAVEEQLAGCSLTFAGLFAKIDYLCKEKNVGDGLARRINSARRHLSEKEHDGRFFAHDLKAVVQFIAAINGVKEMPQTLAKHFPANDGEPEWRKYSTRKVRVVVNKWDNDFIYATEEVNGSEIKICYSKDNRYLTCDGKADASSLKNVIYEHCQLNLVRPRDVAGAVHPELIIFEPDYLVDITTIASCFETYATTPYVNLINKFKTAENTPAIMLGNFASQFLDETVRGENLSYKDSAKRFFRSNGLAMATCEIEKDFHVNAQRQKKIIETLIGNDLPKEVSSYRSKDVVLEPSFFCETLGLQGRMDMLMQNGEDIIIVEQKSGKASAVQMGANGMYDGQRPVHQEKHFVQLLLYRALMVYGFDIPAKALNNLFLLYSKYEKGLLRLGSAPELLHNAIMIRNQIVRCEFDYADRGLDIMMKLSPENLNRNKLSGTFWEQYIRKQLCDVLVPLRQASMLEQKYFLRFMRFLEKEHLLAKIGNRTKENSGFAAKWLETIEEKIEAGNILTGLRDATDDSDSDAPCVTLRLTSYDKKTESERFSSASSFRPGDIVVLFPFEKGKEPNVCAQMVYRASIVEMQAESITLRLRDTQALRHIKKEKDSTLWAVESDLYESSAGVSYRAMHMFLTAPKLRRDLLLCQREARIDSSKRLNGDYGKFNDLQLHAKQAQDYYVIIGPPGTGKTSFGMLYLLKEELTEAGSTVLLTSYTNRAVDEICSKLVEEGIEFLRIGSPLSCSPEYRDCLLEERIKDCNNADDVKKVIMKARVICATTATMSRHTEIFSIKDFTLAIIDEASQILEPHLMAILCATHDGREAVRKFVMIGDHKQLPAVVQQTEEDSIVDDVMLNEIGLTNCRRSLFERLLSMVSSHSRGSATEEDGRNLISLLTHQGRMHRDIAEFPNREFYEGKLDIVPLPHQTAEDNEPRVMFIDVPSPSHDSKNNDIVTSEKVNNAEAAMIARYVVDTYKKHADTFDPLQTVGVIVPYRNQITAVRNAIADRLKLFKLKRLTNLLCSITIDTVERYQGSQRDVIIYGFTVQRRYQLNFLTSNVFIDNGAMIDRRLNVAMTRARKRLILIGNASLLSENITFRRLIDFTQKV